MNPAAQAELAACLRILLKMFPLLDAPIVRKRCEAALESAAPDPNRAMRAAETAPCVASGGMPCECWELLTELMPYVWFQRPDLQQRIEAMVRRDVEGDG